MGEFIVNLLCIPQYTLNSLWIHFVFYEYTVNSLSNRELTRNSPFFCEFIMNSVFVPRINYMFRDHSMNSLSVSRIRYESTIYFANSLSISRKYLEFSIFFENILWINYLMGDSEFALYSATYFEFTMNSLCFSRIYCEFTVRSLSISRIHYQLNIFFANTPIIHNLFSNSLSVSCIHYFLIKLNAYLLPVVPWLNFLFHTVIFT